MIGAVSSKSYPTLAELDTIENYVFAAAKRQLSDFQVPVVAVFAYQYRVGFRTAHGMHADVVFSRTGIARVGSDAPFYDGERRSFWPIPAGRTGTFAVMPVRYAAFIAELAQPSMSFSILRPDERDRAHTFLIPRHKLFAGSECLDGVTIPSIAFHEWHQTEKLRRIHATRALDLVPGFDADAPPLVRGSHELVMLEQAGASVLVVPFRRTSLVRVARQRNAVSGHEEVVRFVVPPKTGSNRFETSLQIPASEHGRAAPEDANIRDPRGPRRQARKRE